MAEQGERPRASPPLGSSAPTARGGGSVAAMVPALRRAVRDAAAAPERVELVEAARALAESIGANLRPPHAQSLGRQEQRDLRAALRSLEQLEARDLEEAKEAEDRRGPADAPLMNYGQMKNSEHPGNKNGNFRTILVPSYDRKKNHDTDVM